MDTNDGGRRAAPPPCCVRGAWGRTCEGPVTLRRSRGPAREGAKQWGRDAVRRAGMCYHVGEGV